jgi:hypothetical protein
MNSNLAGKYALAANIDASATASWKEGGFKPVGSGQSNVFTGTFEGLGHVVRDLSINRPDEDHVGLFGKAKNATLRNVGLIGGRVMGKVAVGALVGTSWGLENGTVSIANAYATGAVHGKKLVGGLAGGNVGEGNGTASISKAYATGQVTGEHFVGGLVGVNVAKNGTASISHASATGAVHGKESVGGLAGGSNGEENGRTFCWRAGRWPSRAFNRERFLLQHGNLRTNQQCRRSRAVH